VISATLYSILSGASAITSLTTGIYPTVIPQTATYPAIAYSKLSTSRVDSFGGTNDLTSGIFQIDCYARSASAAESLAAAVKSTLIDYGTRPINRIRIDNELSLFETETELHRVLLQFTIWHIEG
jgi:Protein of unknown function (DUF3168)